jgi:hypothetical protein
VFLHRVVFSIIFLFCEHFMDFKKKYHQKTKYITNVTT